MASKAISIFGSKIDPKGYVKFSRVATHLDVSVQTIRDWIVQGKIIRPVRINGSWRFEVQAITRWLEINIKPGR